MSRVDVGLGYLTPRNAGNVNALADAISKELPDNAISAGGSEIKMSLEKISDIVPALQKDPKFEHHPIFKVVTDTAFRDMNHTLMVGHGSDKHIGTQNIHGQGIYQLLGAIVPAPSCSIFSLERDGGEHSLNFCRFGANINQWFNQDQENKALFKIVGKLTIRGAGESGEPGDLEWERAERWCRIEFTDGTGNLASGENRAHLLNGFVEAYSPFVNPDESTELKLSRIFRLFEGMFIRLEEAHSDGSDYKESIQLIHASSVKSARTRRFPRGWSVGDGLPLRINPSSKDLEVVVKKESPVSLKPTVEHLYVEAPVPKHPATAPQKFIHIKIQGHTCDVESSHAFCKLWQASGAAQSDKWLPAVVNGKTFAEVLCVRDKSSTSGRRQEHCGAIFTFGPNKVINKEAGVLFNSNWINDGKDDRKIAELEGLFQRDPETKLKRGGTSHGKFRTLIQEYVRGKDAFEDGPLADIPDGFSDEDIARWFVGDRKQTVYRCAGIDTTAIVQLKPNFFTPNQKKDKVSLKFASDGFAEEVTAVQIVSAVRAVILRWCVEDAQAQARAAAQAAAEAEARAATNTAALLAAAASRAGSAQASSSAVLPLGPNPPRKRPAPDSASPDWAGSGGKRATKPATNREKAYRKFMEGYSLLRMISGADISDVVIDGETKKVYYKDASKKQRQLSGPGLPDRGPCPVDVEVLIGSSDSNKRRRK